MVRKFSTTFNEARTRGYSEDIAVNTISSSKTTTTIAKKDNKLKRDVTKEEQWDPNTENLDDELGKEGRERLRELQRASLGDVEKMYSIANDESVDWTMAESQIDKKGNSTVVSVKNPESSKKRHLVKGGTAQDVMDKEAKDFVRGKQSRRDNKAKKRKL